MLLSIIHTDTLAHAHRVHDSKNYRKPLLQRYVIRILIMYETTFLPLLK